MVTMSVRGIITSRATVSPHSKIEWMSSRSSCSSTSSSVASSTMLSSCSSEVKVEARGRPGVTVLPSQASTSASGPSSSRAPRMTGAANRSTTRACTRPTLRGLAPTSTNDTAVMITAAISSTSQGFRTSPANGEGDEHGGARLGEHAEEVDGVDVRARIRGDREQRAAEPGPEGQVLRLGARQGRHGRVAGGEQAAEDDQHDRDDQEEGGHRLTGAASPARRSPRACRAAPGTSPAPPPPRRGRSRAGAGVRGR